LIKRGAQLVRADGILLFIPVNCGRDGKAPLIIRLPNLRAEATQVPTC
jgi:hypothetical protein